MIETISRKTQASVRLICQTLSLPRSSFYHAANPTATQQSDQALGDQIEVIFKNHKGRYGYRRIHRDLKELGLICAPARVRRLMNERGLVAKKPRQFVPKTSDGRADAPSPNRIAGIIPKAPNEIWTGDITYIKTNMGWRYLAVVLDRYSRRVVGWSLADHMRSDLVCDALKMAIATRSNIKGVIFHIDRGSQYGSCPFRGLLKSAHMIQSMSARANPYDNAWTESFIGTLKKEMGELLHKLDPQQIQLNCFHYIEGYYNTQRRHSALGYISPSKFEAIHSLN